MRILACFQVSKIHRPTHEKPFGGNIVTAAMLAGEFFRLNDPFDHLALLRINPFPGILLGLLSVCRVNPYQVMHRHDLLIAPAMPDEFIGVTPKMLARLSGNTIVPFLGL